MKAVMANTESNTIELLDMSNFEEKMTIEEAKELISILQRASEFLSYSFQNKKEQSND